MNIGILASHEGTTMQAVLDACGSGAIPGRVTVVISNNSDSGALRRARAAGALPVHLSRTTHSEPDALDDAVTDALVAAGVDVVMLAGYMRKLGPSTLSTFRGRILNTHPALLPKFGGQGMYGARVHEAVLRSGDRESGASVHLVDAEYDTGAVLDRVRVPVEADDTVETLGARVQESERALVVSVLARIARGELVVDGFTPSR